MVTRAPRIQYPSDGGCLLGLGNAVAGHLPGVSFFETVPSFTPNAVLRLLADSRRHCCVCLRWCGQRIQIHHIVADAGGGAGDYDNGIPVCLDCHAEIESRSNMGRRFTADELKEHRDRWFAIVRDRPEVLLRASQTQTETGPLEALLAELDFNRLAVSGNANEGFP